MAQRLLTSPPQEYEEFNSNKVEGEQTTLSSVNAHNIDIGKLATASDDLPAQCALIVEQLSTAERSKEDLDDVEDHSISNRRGSIYL
jgi:hypothetical protein